MKPQGVSLQAWQEFKGCLRKSKYPDYDSAFRNARAQRHNSGEAIDAYECKFDPTHWHIGHLNPRYTRKKLPAPEQEFLLYRCAKCKQKIFKLRASSHRCTA